jgi:hypothetical protein
MIIVPKERPFIENLNSYYLNIERLIEHCQGELGCGGIHFTSSTVEGTIFFDKDEVLNGMVEGENGVLSGDLAIDQLINSAAEQNFKVSIFKISAKQIYYWASIPEADQIYHDLSTEFTDLEGLFKKMSTEKLTGYIEVSVRQGKEGGMVFFNRGEIVGVSHSWEDGAKQSLAQNQELLIKKTKSSDAVLHVSAIPTDNGKSESATTRSPKKKDSDTITVLEDLMHIVEAVIPKSAKRSANFDTLLKRKCLEKAGKYPFLDPFAAEFEYSGQKISFTGDVSDVELVNAVMEAVEDLAGELGILPQLIDELGSWSQTHESTLSKFGISL